MTYLATEMLLYMAATAVIGLVLGWLVAGLGQRRKREKLRTDLTAKLESEMIAHDKARVSLEKADARIKEAAESARKDADGTIVELKKIVEEERLRAEEAETAMSRLRVEVEETLQQGRESGQEAIDEAMRTANAEKSAAAEAMAREAQSRAQIEELRLLIGAEKLAAETARAELDKSRAELQAEIATERAAHQQAKVALNDIRSTLARTLGADVLNLADGADQGAPGGAPLTTARAPAPFSLMTDMTAAGDALNNPDLDEADIEDRDDGSLELPTIAEDDDGAPEAKAEVVDAPSSPERIELRPVPVEAAPAVRPGGFLERQPERVDDLTAIDGISAEIEQRLREKGCYRFRQLADLTPPEVDWLARAIDVTPYQIAADRWIVQAKELAAKAGDDRAGADGDDGQSYHRRGRPEERWLDRFPVGCDGCERSVDRQEPRLRPHRTGAVASGDLREGGPPADRRRSGPLRFFPKKGAGCRARSAFDHSPTAEADVVAIFTESQPFHATMLTRSMRPWESARPPERGGTRLGLPGSHGPEWDGGAAGSRFREDGGGEAVSDRWLCGVDRGSTLDAALGEPAWMSTLAAPANASNRRWLCPSPDHPSDGDLPGAGRRAGRRRVDEGGFKGASSTFRPFCG